MQGNYFNNRNYDIRRNNRHHHHSSSCSYQCYNSSCFLSTCIDTDTYIILEYVKYSFSYIQKLVYLNRYGGGYLSLIISRSRISWIGLLFIIISPSQLDTIFDLTNHQLRINSIEKLLNRWV